jgi:hypothetical protein
MHFCSAAQFVIFDANQADHRYKVFQVGEPMKKFRKAGFLPPVIFGIKNYLCLFLIPSSGKPF